MKNLIVSFFFILFSFSIHAQEDNLMNLLDENTGNVTNYTTATFKSTRIMNSHSIERMPPGVLDFRVSHRFGYLNSGAYNFFGLDQSNMHLSFEYGFLKWFMAGIGRASFEKTYDAFGKFSILRQSTGAVTMPVSVSAVATVALNTLKSPDPSRKEYFSSRLTYTTQLLVARKFNESFSFQLTPSYVHRNLVTSALDYNDLFAIGAGGRFKLAKRISFNGEYYYIINPKTYMSQKIYDPLSLGFDIETGGHVFQLIFTNSLGMTEKSFIGETTGSWRKGDIHFGFNISRVFTLRKYNEN
jgi:hypothetical protein